MPVYKYECGKCGLEFDKLVSRSEGNAEVGCINCDAPAEKIVGKTNFSFSSTRKQGDTGVHDIDYPVLDKAVGRSAEKRWVKFEDRRAAEDRARADYESPYLGKIPIGDHTDGYYKVPDKRIEERREAAAELHEAWSGS